MDELHGRFRRLDRITAPNLWDEAVGRAAELPMPRRWALSPTMGLLAAALLLAALGGSMALGAWLNQPSEPRETLTFDNGILASSHECGRLVGVDPTSLEQRDLAVGSACDSVGWLGTPAWSSDGSRLAWVAQREGTMGVWIYDPSADEARLVASCEAAPCEQVDISPDGSLVAYSTRDENGLPTLVAVDLASGESDQVSLTGQPFTPRFSPDGSTIALAQLGGRSGIYRVDVGPPGELELGTPVLLGGIVDADHLAWSPNGKWIAYRHYGRMTGEGQVPLTAGLSPAGFGIVITRVDGSDTRVLATGPADEGPQLPTWAPDSQSLAYVTIEEPQPGNWSLVLWTAAIDGSQPTRIYESGCCKDGFGAPSWSPDGEWIAFGLSMLREPARTGTYVIRPDGSDLRRVSSETLDPVWQPIPRND